MTEFAREVEEGSLKFPKSEQEYADDFERPENIMLRGIVKELSNVDLPEANRALYALANPKHAYYPVASLRVLEAFSRGREFGEWCWHPLLFDNSAKIPRRQDADRREIPNQRRTIIRTFPDRISGKDAPRFPCGSQQSAQCRRWTNL